MRLTYDISQLSAYINWPYFFYAWQVREPAEKERLRREAETVLQQLEGRYRAYALFLLFDADTDGDDILVGAGKRIPCLRQQEKGSGYQCLADFVSSHHAPRFLRLASLLLLWIMAWKLTSMEMLIRR